MCTTKASTMAKLVSLPGLCGPGEFSGDRQFPIGLSRGLPLLPLSWTARALAAFPSKQMRLEKINTLIVPANAAEYDRLIAAETATLTALIRDRSIRLAE